VMTSTFENVSDIGVCLGLCLAPPANAGVRSKQGAVHITEIERSGFEVVRARKFEDAEIAVQTDAAIGCMVVDWGKKGLEGKSAALIDLMRRRGLDLRLCRCAPRRDGPVIAAHNRIPQALPHFPAASSLERISLPYSSLERDFCHRRQTRQTGPGDDISAQRLEIHDHDAREMAANTAFVLEGLNI
jgi:hypothetical protein